MAYKANDGPVLGAVEDQIQTAFNEGFTCPKSDAPNPYLFSSSCWVAWQTGRLYFNAGGHGGRLITCRATRGVAVKLGNGAVYRLVGGVVIQTERGKA